ncbi:hypothetical protein SAMD00023353_0900130 [Rosellinia necatrix]|uniref:BAG domain-containing protein n=1 Tax=Rosellinia necatrix TaxID=77044 RepID=A0A1W2THF3_ROSNE|nr:hypothetical protein SAMD00023353_0900130 [Rosellinia necatrix]
MSRYSWSSFRDGWSPFTSQGGSQDGPHVTDDDFSYITSEDLETPITEEDDVILIKHRSTTSRENFPAYSIGDGRLTVRDVRERVGLLMDIKSSRRIAQIKMLYKGRNLKEQDIPIRDYGVKNNSELLIVVPEGRLSDDDESSSTAEEVIVSDPRDEPRALKKKKNKNGKKKLKGRGPKETSSSLEHSSRMPSPAVPSGGPLAKLQTIRSHFERELLPLCNQFARNPPKDPKKAEEEHRKLSETVMLQVVLKLDEVDTGGDINIRQKRKDLVNYVQAVLKEIDDRVPAGVKSNR